MCRRRHGHDVGGKLREYVRRHGHVSILSDRHGAKPARYSANTLKVGHGKIACLCGDGVGKILRTVEILTDLIGGFVYLNTRFRIRLRFRVSDGTFGPTVLRF